jgi:hypothetical protein
VRTTGENFDGDALLARSGIDVVTVDAPTIGLAEKQIDFCEHCHPDDSETPFDWILDGVTGRSGATTDYVLVGRILQLFRIRQLNKHRRDVQLGKSLAFWGVAEADPPIVSGAVWEVLRIPVMH